MAIEEETLATEALVDINFAEALDENQKSHLIEILNLWNSPEGSEILGNFAHSISYNYYDDDGKQAYKVRFSRWLFNAGQEIYVIGKTINSDPRAKTVKELTNIDYFLEDDFKEEHEKVLYVIKNTDAEISDAQWQKNINREIEFTNRVYPDSLSQPIFRKEDNKLICYILGNRIKGKDLFEYLSKNPGISFEERISICLKVTQEIEKIHQKRIIHRDIKPENIMYDPETQTVRIIDFEMSLNFGEQHARLLGTALYAAPDETQTEKSDIFSFGITALAILGADLGDAQVYLEKIGFQINNYYKEMKINMMMFTLLSAQEDGSLATLSSEEKKEMENFFKKIFSHEPDKRPNPEKIITYFKNLFENISGHSNMQRMEEDNTGSPIASDDENEESFSAKHFAYSMENMENKASISNATKMLLWKDPSSAGSEEKTKDTMEPSHEERNGYDY